MEVCVALWTDAPQVVEKFRVLSDKGFLDEDEASSEFWERLANLRVILTWTCNHLTYPFASGFSSDDGPFQRLGNILE